MPMSAAEAELDYINQRERINYDRQAGTVMNTILRRIGFTTAERSMGSGSSNGPKSYEYIIFDDKDRDVRDRLVEAFLEALDNVEIPQIMTPLSDPLRGGGLVTDNVTINTETADDPDMGRRHKFEVAVLGNPGTTFNQGWASAAQKKLELFKAIDTHLEARGFKDPTPGATFK